jgi:FtsH-binding integral membrane protein
MADINNYQNEAPLSDFNMIKLDLEDPKSAPVKKQPPQIPQTQKLEIQEPKAPKEQAQKPKVEKPKAENPQPLEVDLRRNFVKKVYGILACQLLFTTVVTLILNWSGASDSLRNAHGFSVLGGFLFALAMITMLAIFVIMICYGHLARKVPHNYIILIAYTIAMTILCAINVAGVDPKYVIGALLLTASLTIVLTVYAFKMKSEITYRDAGKFILAWFVVAMLVWIILVATNTYSMGYGVFSLILIVFYGFFLVWDTKMIIGQKNSRVQLNMDEYIIGALWLYVDVIGIFFAMLGAGRRRFFARAV